MFSHTFPPVVQRGTESWGAEGQRLLDRELCFRLAGLGLETQLSFLEPTMFERRSALLVLLRAYLHSQVS